MKVAVLCAPSAHWKKFSDRLSTGILASGDQVCRIGVHEPVPPDVDVIACWGWRNGRRFRIKYSWIPVLVLERGYVGDRFLWTSLGWNGLNGNAIFPTPPAAPHGPYDRWARMSGEKFRATGRGYMEPWRDPEKPGYALILGQVQTDQACCDVNLAYQYRIWRDYLMQRGYAVKFRQHPKAGNQASPFRRAEMTYGSLAEDLADAKFTVSWNSNSSVDSILAGVPSVTYNSGAMAWPVTSHSLVHPVTMPERTAWAAQLAWCQWQPSELSDGTAWRAVREAKP